MSIYLQQVTFFLKMSPVVGKCSPIRQIGWFFHFNISNIHIYDNLKSNWQTHFFRLICSYNAMCSCLLEMRSTLFIIVIYILSQIYKYCHIFWKKVANIYNRQHLCILANFLSSKLLNHLSTMYKKKNNCGQNCYT